MNFVMMSPESTFSLCSVNITINLYVFGPLVKWWIQCNVKCNLIISHKFHFLLQMLTL